MHRTLGVKRGTSETCGVLLVFVGNPYYVEFNFGTKIILPECASLNVSQAFWPSTLEVDIWLF